jgi:hypothetical protein
VRVRKKQSSAIIAADVMRFGHVINTDGVLGTHNWLKFKNPEAPTVKREAEEDWS